MKNLKTYSTKKDDLKNRKWYLVDVDGKNLGRTASKIALILRGKNKPDYTPSMDMGDFVVVVNAEKIAVTGKKEDEKVYYRHTGFPGGLKSETVKTMRAKHPDRILRSAVKGMLPKNSLGAKMLKKLKICVGENHEYQAQKPEKIEI